MITINNLVSNEFLTIFIDIVPVSIVFYISIGNKFTTILVIEVSIRSKVSFNLDSTVLKVNFDVINGLFANEFIAIGVVVIPVAFIIADILVMESRITLDSNVTLFICDIMDTFSLKGSVLDFTTIVFVEVVDFIININEFAFSLMSFWTR